MTLFVICMVFCSGAATSLVILGALSVYEQNAAMKRREVHGLHPTDSRHGIIARWITRKLEAK